MLITVEVCCILVVPISDEDVGSSRMLLHVCEIPDTSFDQKSCSNNTIRHYKKSNKSQHYLLLRSFVVTKIYIRVDFWLTLCSYKSIHRVDFRKTFAH